MQLTYLVELYTRSGWILNWIGPIQADLCPIQIRLKQLQIPTERAGLSQTDLYWSVAELLLETVSEKQIRLWENTVTAILVSQFKSMGFPDICNFRIAIWIFKSAPTNQMRGVPKNLVLCTVSAYLSYSNS